MGWGCGVPGRRCSQAEAGEARREATSAAAPRHGTRSNATTDQV